MAIMLFKRKISVNLLMVALSVTLIAIGLYALLTALAPLAASTLVNPGNNQTLKRMSETQSKITEDRLYIPKIDVNLPYATGTADTMLTGAWWRSPSSGNPKDGGNFVLSAHRFVMDWTPGGTIKRSPFYNIDKLDAGDTITVDYRGERYTYTVDKKYAVAPTAIEIEAPTRDNRLTLYSCGLGGASDKRDVIIAKLDKAD